ncbi:MAG: alpha/beta fold hydrolase [Bacteroidia bacterium]|nr:alpha/beta fold hydrolase [Bacteroidia bacterium]
MISGESIYTEVGAETLHLKRFYGDNPGEAVLCIHGAIENGRIFYSADGEKGFAPWLAAQGFDVYVADLRGRGMSTPTVGPQSNWGLKEIIDQDLSAYLAKIREIRGEVKLHWVSHSWGGVLILAWLARNPVQTRLKSMVFFGTKRRIGIKSLQKWFMINFFWRMLGDRRAVKAGFFNSVKWGYGSDNESIRSHREMSVWIDEIPWIDWHDGFDYAAALQQMDLPPILYLTGSADKVLGHPADVQRFYEETGAQNGKVMVIGKQTGHLHDYNHISLLTHPDAVNDQFLLALEWLQTRHALSEIIRD